MRHRASSGPAILVAAAVIAIPPAARAEGSWSGEVPAKARSLAERGRQLHDAGDYAAAITAFTQAYVIAPSPALLFNLAQAYRLQGNCDDAALMYRRYLATSPTPEGRVLAEAHLATVERCLRKLSLNIPVETPQGIVIKPRSGSLMASEASEPGPGGSRLAQFEKDVGVGLMLGGTVVLGLAGYYAIEAHSAAGEVAAAYEKGAKWKDVAPIDSRGKSAAANAKLLGGGGAIGVAGGVALYLLGRHTERRTLPTVTPTGRGVAVNMSWAF